MTGHRVLVALSALCSLLFLLWVLWFCRFGVDFRDEGLYFVWMANPFKYDFSVTQFGYLYHPFFELVDHSIVGIRRLNLVFTFALAWVLADRCLLTRGFSGTRSVRITLSAGLAVASLSFLHVWLPTPSYNWMALQGLMITCTGLLMSERAPRYQVLFPVLVGFGGWLTFMAKPSTAAGLAVCALVYLVISRKFAWKPMLFTVAVAVLLLLGIALVIDGSVLRFIERYQISIHMAKVMMGQNNPMSLLPRLGTLRLDPATRAQIIGGVCALVVLSGLATLRSRAAAVLSQLGILVLAVATLMLIFGRFPALLGIENYRGLLVGIIPLAALVVLPLRWLQKRPAALGIFPDVLLILAMPVIYVLGTSNDNWWQISHATLFWALAAAMLAVVPKAVSDSATDSSSVPTAASWHLAPVLAIVLATQFITAAIVQTGIEAPYGQSAGLRNQHQRVTLGLSDATLRLTPGFASYLNDAQRKSAEVGFAPGMPLIDLTGRSPSVLYAMRASSTAGAWLIGGYPGSDPLASAMLERTSCEELARAWLLYQPVGSTGLSPKILSVFGADMEADYEVATTIVLSERFFGSPEHWVQHLLKPRRSPEVAEAACVKARSAKP